MYIVHNISFFSCIIIHWILHYYCIFQDKSNETRPLWRDHQDKSSKTKAVRQDSESSETNQQDKPSETNQQDKATVTTPVWEDTWEKTSDKILVRQYL